MSDSEDSDPFDLAGLNTDVALDSSFDSLREDKKSSAPKKASTPAATKPAKTVTSPRRREVDEESAINCGVCGKSNLPDYKFCRGCGSEADGSSGVESSIPSAEPPARRAPPTGRGRASPPPSATALPNRPAVGRGRASVVSRATQPPSTNSSTIADDDAANDDDYEQVTKHSPKPTLPAKSPRTAAATSSGDGEETNAVASKPPRPVSTLQAGRGRSNLTNSAPSVFSNNPEKNGTSTTTSSGGTTTAASTKPAGRGQMLAQSESNSALSRTSRGAAASVASPGTNRKTVSPTSSSASTSASSTQPPTLNVSGSPRPESTGGGDDRRDTRKLSVSGSQIAEVLEARTAEDSTRAFLQEVVRMHEEGIRDPNEETAASSVAIDPNKKKARQPTLRLKGTWSRSTRRKGMDGSIASWTSVGIEALGEEGGGFPLVISHATRYFMDKKCYSYPGLFKTMGSVATVNRLLESFADASFTTFDQADVTPLDVATCVRSFLLILPDSPVPGAMFYELLEAGFEVNGEKRILDVRSLLMKVNAVGRVVLREVLDWSKRILAAQSSLQLHDVASFLGPALARPTEGNHSETDSQSYAIALALLEMGDLAFEAKELKKPSPGGHSSTMLQRVVAESAISNGEEVAQLKDELSKANEKIASLTRQLDEARKGHVALKKKLEVAAKENGELKRKNTDLQKMVDSWKANSIMDMY